MAIKIPPHNDEAEQSVLGALLIDKNAINIVSELLRREHFYNELYATIYGAMLALYEASKPIDVLTITTQLKKQKMHTKITPVMITDLIENVPTAANVEQYAEIVRDMATKRMLIQSGTNIVEMGFQEANEIKEILDQAESAIFSISQGHHTRGFVQIKDTLADSFDRIDELHRSGAGLRGIETGFHDLDHILSGMQKSNLIILAARPGTGKTAFMVNMAQHIALNEKKAIGIFSLEMSKEELVDRMLVAQADIDAWRLKTGNKLTDDDFKNLSDAMGQLAEAPIFIDDTPGISIVEMRSKARRLQLEHNVGVIFVDYLQLVDPGKKYDNRVQEVSVVSQSLKNLARELRIPVLSASQLNRSVENRGNDRRPQLSDLRESGAIEQDADVVMFLYRPDTETTGIHIPTKLFIAKHRNGATGEIDLMFRGDRIRFFGVDKSHSSASPLAN
jgi:replicative DNA helicase